MYFHVRLVTGIILIFLSGNNGLSIRLSSLRPDLEYLREYWLQSPSEKDREGRIVFSNQTQVLVDFEKSLNPIQDAAWSKGFLRLRSIHEMPTKLPVTAIDELYYKHSSFYVRRYPYSIPESLQEGRRDWITTLPIDAGAAETPSVEVHYIGLNNLATTIENKIVEIDSTATKNVFVPLRIGDNEFPFDFVKGRSHLFVRHVRIIEFVHVQRLNPENVPNSENDASDYVHYIRSEETPLIRYDRHVKSFFTVGNELLDHRSFIRSSVGNYTLWP